VIAVVDVVVDAVELVVVVVVVVVVIVAAEVIVVVVVGVDVEVEVVKVVEVVVIVVAAVTGTVIGTEIAVAVEIVEVEEVSGNMLFLDRTNPTTNPAIPNNEQQKHQIINCLLLCFFLFVSSVSFSFSSTGCSFGFSPLFKLLIISKLLLSGLLIFDGRIGLEV
jgi:hypothetical protein